MLAFLLNLLARVMLPHQMGRGMRLLAAAVPMKGAGHVVMTSRPGLSPREAKGRWPSGFA